MFLMRDRSLAGPLVLVLFAISMNILAVEPEQGDTYRSQHGKSDSKKCPHKHHHHKCPRHECPDHCSQSFVVNPKAGTVCPGDSITFATLVGNSGCNLRLTAVSNPINGGTVVIDFATNSFTYTAPVTQPSSGTDSFKYTLQDICGNCKTAPVVITIPCCTPCCTAFVVNDLSATVCPAESVTFDTLTEGGNSGCDLMLVDVGTPENGGTVSFDLATGVIIYTAPAIIPPSGTDRVSYTLSSQVGPPSTRAGAAPTATAEKSAFINISMVCCTPCCQGFTVNPKSATVCPGQSQLFDALAGNTGCDLQLVSASKPNFGTVVVDAVANTFTYVAPVVAPVSAVDSFVYVVSSVVSARGSDSAQVTQEKSAPVTITLPSSCGPCNQPFEVNPKSATVCPGTSATFSATEGNSGCNLQLVSVTQPPAGTGSVVADVVSNTFTYVAPVVAPVVSVTSFDYVVSSVVSSSVSAAAVDPTQVKKATVTIQLPTCAPCSVPFIVNPKSGTVCPGASETFSALDGNSGCNLQLVSVTQPPAGTGVVVPDVVSNTFTYVAPVVAPVAVTSFTYVVSSVVSSVLAQDPVEQKSAPVIITLPASCAPCNGPFMVNQKSATVCPGASTTFDALAGNTGCSLMLARVSQPEFGTVTVQGNSFTYTAPEKQPEGGMDRFTYTLSSQVSPFITQKMTADVIITIPNCCFQIIRSPTIALYDELILHERP